MRFIWSNSSVSEPTTIVGHDLQGQIRGQMTGITLEPKVTVRLKNNDLMRFLGSNSSVSEPTTIVGYDLQGQIRDQMTGITLEPKVTVRFEK